MEDRIRVWWVGGRVGGRDSDRERLPVKRFYKGKVGDSKCIKLDGDAVEAAKTVSLLTASLRFTD